MNAKTHDFIKVGQFGKPAWTINGKEPRSDPYSIFLEKGLDPFLKITDVFIGKRPVFEPNLEPEGIGNLTLSGFRLIDER